MDYGLLKVIDGQHRLLGYSKTESSTQQEKRFMVVILENLLDSRKAKIFLDINSKSKTVDPSLQLLISHDVDWPTFKKTEQKEKIVVGNIFKLIEDNTLSEEKIFLGHAGIEKKQKLTLRTAVTSIKKIKMGIKNEEASYIELKNLIIKLKSSKNSEFYLSNIGFRIVAIIISRYKENKELVKKIGLNDLIDRLDIIPKKELTTVAYGEGGAGKRAKKLIAILRTKFPEEFAVEGFE